MLTAAVTAWLDSSDDYDAGLVLLRQTNRCSAFLLTLLHKGDDAYNRKRLADELQGWLATATTGSVDPVPVTIALDYGAGTAPVVASTTPPKVVVGSMVKNNDAAVASLNNQVYQLINERSEYKARIRARMNEGNDERLMAERLPLAMQIKRITRQTDEVMSQVDFQAQHGYLPLLAPDPAVLVDDTAALLNARSYVSRYKAKLKKKTLTPEQRQSAQQLLDQYEAEKQRLTLKLNKTATADRGEHDHDFNQTG